MALATSVAEECPDILCDRSLMSLRMEQYHEAESGAKDCIEKFPSHINGYWRACQAVKGEPDGTQRALAYLVKGFPVVMTTGHDEDISDFLTELCSLIPKADANSDVLHPLHKVKWSHVNSDIWMKVLRNLDSQGTSVENSMLIKCAHKGPSQLAKRVIRYACVSSVLKTLPESSLKAWGISLLVQLLLQNAKIDDIGSKIEKPTIHTALEISLHTGHLHLLDTVLDLYKDDPVKLNDTNSQGQTVLHVLVLTRNTNQLLHIDALERLLEYKCDVLIDDEHRQGAIDYLHQSHPAWQRLRTVVNTALEELRRNIEELRNMGSSALKDGDMYEYRKCFKQALQLSENSKETFKEAAKLYSYLAKVDIFFNKYGKAYGNALAAIKRDKSWYKGYWWKAKSLCGMCAYKDGFFAFIEGHTLPELTRKVRLQFLEEAVILLHDLQEPDLTECYQLLSIIKTSLWPPILAKISKATEWRCLAYLLIGTNLNLDRFGLLVTRDSISKLLIGVAGNVTKADVHTETVFVYLRRENQGTKCFHWLDAALFAVYLLDMERTLERLREDEGDTSLHAVTRFSLMTGRSSLLNEVLSEKLSDGDGEINSHGDSVFHIITKMEPIPDSNTLRCVTKKLLKRGYSLVVRDAWELLPLDYLNKSHVDQAFIFYITFIKDSINQLKEDEEIKAALSLYTMAINMFRIHDFTTERERAMLYANRSEANSRIKMYEFALRDAHKSLQQDRHWYKAHIRLGKCYCDLDRKDIAYNHYINGYNELDPTVPDKMKVDILKEICFAARRGGDLKKRLLHYPEPHLWALTAYELMARNDWTSAYKAFSLMKGEDAQSGKVTSSLQPLSCDLSQLQSNPWSYYLIEFLLESGASVESILCKPWNTCLSTAVMKTLLVGRSSLLNEVLSKKLPGEDGEINSHGDSVFHMITKMKPIPDSNTLVYMTYGLLKKGYSLVVRDASGRLPIDYLNQSHVEQVFEFYLTFIKDTINQLKKDGEIKAAMKLYTQTIHMLGELNTTNRERAVLYANRAEGYLRLMMFDNAHRDARESVRHDWNWYKAHMRLGKCLCKLNRMDDACKVYTDAYNVYVNSYIELDHPEEDKTKMDIMKEICFAARPNKRVGDLKKLLLYHPGRHLWALTAYELIDKKDFAGAYVAYSLVTEEEVHSCHITGSLQPLSCDLRQLKANPWILSLIKVLLEGGANLETILGESGDTCLHEVVRMTLVVDQSDMDLLTYLLETCCQDNNGTGQHKVDTSGNTLLHVAVREVQASQEYMQKVVMLLLQYGVDPKAKNDAGKRAVDLLSREETPSHETLRMAMYSQGSQVRQQAPDSQLDLSEKTETITGAKLCDECDDLYMKALSCFDGGRVNTGYDRLMELMQKQHNNERHETLLKKSVVAIAQNLGKVQTPAIPRFLMYIPRDLSMQVIQKLAENNHWRQLDSFVRRYRAIQGSNQLRGFASGMTVVPVIVDKSLQKTEDLKIQIMNNLLHSGASLGDDGGQTAIETAQKMEHFKVLSELILQGADTTTLSFRDGDTPIHAALTLVLEKTKAPGILEFLLDKHAHYPAANTHLSPDQLDVNCDCLFHIVARAKYSSTALDVTKLLCGRGLSSHYYNKVGKLPVECLGKKNDKRKQLLLIAGIVKPTYHPSQAIFLKQKTKGEKEELIVYERHGKDHAESVLKVVPLCELKQTIEGLIMLLPDVSTITMDNVPINNTNSENENPKGFEISPGNGAQMTEKSGPEQVVCLSTTSVQAAENSMYSYGYGVENSSATKDYIDIVESVSGSRAKVTGLSNQTDSLEKVESGAKAFVKSGVKGLPHVGTVITVQAEGIHELADRNEQDDAQLRPLVTKFQNGNVQIIANYGRGEEFEEDDNIDIQVFDNLEWEVECTAQFWKTLRDGHVPMELKRRIIRKIQLLASGDWQPVLRKKLAYTLPGLRLYEAKISKGSRMLWELAVAFSPRCSETADRRLNTAAGEINQPVKGGKIYSDIIRVWDIVLDHDKLHRSVERINKSHKRGEQCIIQKKLRGIKSDVPNNAKGAGKCYPRMYAEEDVTVEDIEVHKHEMQRFYPAASANDREFHILKFYSFSSALVSHVLQDIETNVDFPFRVTDLEHAIINLRSKSPILLLGRSGTGKTTCCIYRLWSQFHTYWSAAQKAGSPVLPRCVEFVHRDMNDNNAKTPHAGKCTNEQEGNETEDVEKNDTPIFDHIHQIFIAKNERLCSEVQKHFRELSHADELMETHVQYEADVLPNRLQDVGDYIYPLFITSKQLLLMLDASIDPPHFFERKADGSLNAVSRREITYAVFVEGVWPKIRKSRPDYHPSLVWTEIMSFIKGSYEALSKTSGYLQLEEYVELGKKRASNFSGDRETIYQLFMDYEHFKRQQHLFDETDLVHSVYTRIAKKTSSSLPWVIHQIYVDETQDFTQAELCLLIRLCLNPNDMFLTGDTAQSIMRGISFRFSDLRSLFYHAKQSMHAMGKTSAIEVPKQVYQLTHNYRSHAGILSLASSILDLLTEFFPESFDRLHPDQGMFQGPQPILLESCSFGDLAVLLRGNRRKTSQIEFGAHQAILVVNDETKDNIPKELRLGLVLTIYEAKGLEFDDVLLYNFFKDSQANKEWRVVTEFLERLTDKHQEKRSDQESLISIDANILNQKNRSRPLDFDPNQHKILNSELKHLYTALTRARVNVWIFDEDEKRRKPMFEYFKARKLVKFVSEINESSLTETMFAEKSSPEEWCKRGDEFMIHSLYASAAKCFDKGHDVVNKKIALAYDQFQKAQRLKENSALMKEEFLYAAQLFLESGLPEKAVICLEKAKEMELSVQLYEKLGEFEKSAELYTRLNLPIASSRCNGKLGNFNKEEEEAVRQK